MASAACSSSARWKRMAMPDHSDFLSGKSFDQMTGRQGRCGHAGRRRHRAPGRPRLGAGHRRRRRQAATRRHRRAGVHDRTHGRDGQAVDTLVAGQYQLLVHDLSDIHNWALGSQTTNTRILQTDVPFVGDQTFTVDLTPGRYAYACSAHPNTMNGTFIVVPPDGHDEDAVREGGRTLGEDEREEGRGRPLPDHGGATRSRTRNFHLVGPGVNRKTGKTFTGAVTWTLRPRAPARTGSAATRSSPAGSP